MRAPGRLARTVAALAALAAGCATPAADAERDLRAFYDARVRGDIEGASHRLTTEGRVLSNSLRIRDFRIEGYVIRSVRVADRSGAAMVTLRLVGTGAAEADEDLELVHRDGRWRIARLQRSLLRSVSPIRFEILAVAVEPAGCRGPVRVVVTAAARGAITDPADVVTHVVALRGARASVVRVAVTPRALRSAGTARIVAIDGLRLAPGRYRVTARIAASGAAGVRMERELECPT